MLKRPLLCMSFLFTAGICASLLEIDLAVVIFVVAVFFVAGRIILKEKTLLCLTISLFLLFGFVRMELAQNRRDEIGALYGGKTFSGEMLVTEFSEDGRVTASFEDHGQTYKTYLNTDDSRQLYPGDILKGNFVFSEPFRAKVGLSDFSSYLCSRGIYLNARTDSFELSGRKTEGFKGAIYSLRRFMDKVGEKHFKGDSRALFNAMIFGDKRLMSEKLDNALKASGLSHIAVVSGMHIATIIMAISFFFKQIFGKRRHVNVFAIVGAVIVTFLTGAGASVIRAFVMCAIYHFSKITYRDNDIYTTIGISVLAMLLFNPFFLLNIGFVLSVFCVMGIVLFSSKTENVIGRFLPKTISNPVAISIAAQLCVLPVLMLNMRTINPYAIISNILVCFVSSVYVIGGMLFFLVSQIPVISDAVRMMLQLSADIIGNVSLAVSRIPGAIVETGKISTPFIMCWVYMLVLLYYYPLKFRKVKYLTYTLAIFLFIVPLWSGNVKMNMFLVNYGRESLTAMQLSDGGTVYVDCPDAYDVIDCKNYFDEEVSCLILSANSSGELSRLLENGAPDVVVASDSLWNEKDELISLAKEAKSRVIFLKDGEGIGVSGAWIEYLPFENISGRAVRIEYRGVTFVTLQGLTSKEIATIDKENVKIECDYLRLPYTVTHKGETLSHLTKGKVVQYEKSLTVR